MDEKRLSLLRSIGQDKEIANHEIVAECVYEIEDLIRKNGMVAGLFRTPEGEAALTVNILREFDTEKRYRFALHLLGDQAQSVLAEVTCGCGDIRYRGDMCHLCGRCQLACCDCGEKLDGRFSFT